MITYPFYLYSHTLNQLHFTTQIKEAWLPKCAILLWPPVTEMGYWELWSASLLNLSPVTFLFINLILASSLFFLIFISLCLLLCTSQHININFKHNIQLLSPYKSLDQMRDAVNYFDHCPARFWRQELSFCIVFFFPRKEGNKRELQQKVGPPVTSWIVGLSPDWVVELDSWLGTLCSVLGQDNLPLQGLSPPTCIKNGYCFQFLFLEF